MIYDDSLPEFVPGGAGAHLAIRFAPNGPPPMYAAISDPMAPENRMSSPVRKWELRRPNTGKALVWAVHEEVDSMRDSTSELFQGEELLIPDSIPDELWHAHFRQHDADLNDRKEADFLLQLFKQTCGRWPVIYDRWQMHPVYGLRGKSVEALKSKFNKIAMKLLEIDLLQRKRPASAMERIQVSQQLKYLPLFSMKYNEKNEYLRRLFLDNAFKRGVSADHEKAVSEIMRVPTMMMKKKSQQSKPPVAPGPHAASTLITTLQSEVTNSEYNRVKAVLKGLGVDRASTAITPKLAKLMATVEKEAATLLMMRDSLQRKKQELEILRTSGGNGAGAMRMRGAAATPPPAITVSPNAPNSAPPQTIQPSTTPAAITISQQKRKR